MTGTLMEADFENLSARLRSPMGGAVTVTFTESLADEIQDALRHQAEFEGHVLYDPQTSTARSVWLTRINRGKQLVLGVDPDEFWVTRTLAELAQEQGIGQSGDPEAIYDPEASEEEREAFLTELANFG